jgi:hypothetical protein
MTGLRLGRSVADHPTNRIDVTGAVRTAVVRQLQLGTHDAWTQQP